jgi:hypothetical protein
MEIKLHLSRKPTGKVSQLPAELVEHVNQSIHQGVEYKTIIQQLTDKGHPGMNKFNLSRWRRSGYTQWLLAKERRDTLMARTEAAVEQVRNMAAKDEESLRRFNENLVAMQMADTIGAFDAAKLDMGSQPDTFFKLVRLHNQHESTAIARDRLEVEAKKLTVYGGRRSS